ncbi:hypothetical protein BV22DRAFT_1027896 [Leucogyrophana mollusca]|uniref:Uncharacterized protein n=1 Tax=Leucogyrophana mollusca TaxID=85980 RepID=A0ACB8BZS0_9AGAM|nr:hypothetical protein BV22DRAFT_1027896 [Leucogyrophana mollusca]
MPQNVSVDASPQAGQSQALVLLGFVLGPLSIFLVPVTKYALAERQVGKMWEVYCESPLD